MEPVELQPTAPLSAPVQVFDRQISWSKGLTERPDLLQAKLDVERQGITIKYNYNQLFPELDIVGSYGHSAGGWTSVNSARRSTRSLQGSRPYLLIRRATDLPDRQHRRARHLQEKQTGDGAVLLTLKKLEQTIMITIDNDITQAKSSYQQVAATRAAREYAAEALDAEQKKLENGKSTTYTVLQMQRDLTTARGNEIQALATYNKALAQLSLDEGTTLQRLGINVEVK